ncbi:uncharacterized protein LOC127136325 [Lathyrus oleraceus]|uniref:uncharacterized protein LOC127136325 n=1 Tax=Pisum sativum TaxID=3888 RepID=UPI0021CF6B34|nr:uncharacterized protein LOC127136325 [Pisum sativum]
METYGSFLELENDLNNISLEELVSSLRSYEIELEKDEPYKREEDFEEEKGNVTLLETTRYPTSSKEPEDKVSSESESDSDSEETSLTVQLKHQSLYLDNGFSRHMAGRRSMFQDLDLKLGGFIGFRGNQKGKVIVSGTIGNDKLTTITNVLLVNGLMHDILSIS